MQNRQAAVDSHCVPGRKVCKIIADGCSETTGSIAKQSQPTGITLNNNNMYAKKNVVSAILRQLAVMGRGSSVLLLKITIPASTCLPVQANQPANVNLKKATNYL